MVKNKDWDFYCSKCRKNVRHGVSKLCWSCGEERSKRLEKKGRKRKKKILMVSHGGITHLANAPCKFCDKVKAEYDKEMTNPKTKEKSMKKILVGIRPTGRLHLGHWFAVIKPALETGCDVLIADHHAPSGDGDKLEKDLRAFGVKNIKRQKDVLNADLFFRLLEIASIGELSRMTQYKSAEKPTPHLFVYPVLMAHDVAGYEEVVVGLDQRQHLEFARNILPKLGIKPPNRNYSGGKIMSLANPLKKMSKSDLAGCVFLDDDYKTIKEKVKKAVTTPRGEENLKELAERFGCVWVEGENERNKKVLARAIFEELK